MAGSAISRVTRWLHVSSLSTRCWCGIDDPILVLLVEGAVLSVLVLMSRRQSFKELNSAMALTPAARQVQLAVLRTFVETGHGLSRHDLEHIAGAESTGVLAELAQRDALAFDASGEIRAAYPFSPRPTWCQVTWEGGPVVHAMCAIDALGMSVMLDRRVVITASPPDGGPTVVVHVDHDQARWSPSTAVVYSAVAGPEGCAPAVDRSCAYRNFFATEQAARDWGASHPELTGEVLDQARALTFGITVFGTLMAETRV